MKTLREAFEHMKKHMLEQKCCSVDDTSGECAYRNDDGLKCAVGCLIDDNNYNVGLEGYTISFEQVKIAVKNSSWPVCNEAIRMYQRFQHCHDNLSINEWEKYIDELEKNYFPKN